MPAQTVKPVEAMKDFGHLERVSRLLHSASYYLSSYRNTPNDPLFERDKIRLWNGYQETLAELREAIDGQ